MNGIAIIPVIEPTTKTARSPSVVKNSPRAKQIRKIFANVSLARYFDSLLLAAFFKESKVTGSPRICNFSAAVFASGKLIQIIIYTKSAVPNVMNGEIINNNLTHRGLIPQ